VRPVRRRAPLRRSVKKRCEKGEKGVKGAIPFSLFLPFSPF
jgi:hypothetical protein